MATVPEYRVAAGGAGRLTPAGGSVRRPSPITAVTGTISACRSLRSPAPVTGPEVVAHRGATAEAPEHTLAAYRHAAAIGADAVECDVRMTRDGVLVCVHDRQIRRTSNGRGVVSALHLDELEQFHFGAAPPDPAATGGPTTRSPPSPTSPTSRTAWSSRWTGCSSTSPPRPGTVRLAIETKHPTRHTRKVEEALVDCLRRFGLLGNGRAGRVGGQARRPDDELLAAGRPADARAGARHPDGAADRQAAAAGAPELLSGTATAVGPGIGLLRVGPRLRRRRPRRRQGGPRLDGQPARRHGLRARARRRRGRSPTTPTSCSAGSARRDVADRGCLTA